MKFHGYRLITFLCFLVALTPIFVFSQKGYIQEFDSLIKASNHINSDSAIYIAKNALNIAEKYNHDSLRLKGIGVLATKYHAIGDYDNYETLVHQYSKLAKNLNDSIGMMRAYNFMAIIYSVKEDNNRSIEYYDSSLQLSLALNDTNSLIYLYGSIGLTYMELKDNFDYAVPFLEKAINLTEHYDTNHNYYAYNLIYLGLTKAQPSEFVPIFDKAEKIALRNNDFYAITGANYERGNAFFNVDKYDDALANFLRSDSIAHANNFSGYYLMLNAMIAKTYWFLGKYEKSLEFIHSYLALQDSSNIDSIELSEIYKTAILSHGELGNYSKAHEYTKAKIELDDDIDAKKISDKFAEFNRKFNTEQKEKQIAEQELEIARQTNARNRTLFGGILALLLASSIFTWYYQRQKRKKKEAELAFQLEKAEVDNLRHLDELKSNFFTNLSHELRTPLTLIMGPLAEAREKVKRSPCQA